MKYFALLTLIFVSPLAVANVGTFLVGNGGDALVCYKNPNPTKPNPKQSSSTNNTPREKLIKKPKAQTIQLLDFYEGRTLQGLTIQLSNHKDVQTNVKILLARLSVYGDTFSKQLKKYFHSFQKEALFLADVRLTNIEDSYHLVTPTYCAVEQIAIQTIPELPGDPRYIINKDLWDIMPSADRAGLILHELLYRFLIEHRPSHSTEPLHSMNVRRLTALTAADSIHLLGVEGFVNFLKERLFFDCEQPSYGADHTTFKCLN